jgi:hypothetical protein
MATISSDVLASYAADAAREVDGLNGFVESTLHRHKGIRVLEAEGGVASSSTSRWTGVRRSPTSGGRSSGASPPTSRRWPASRSRRFDVVVDEIGPP